LRIPENTSSLEDADPNDTIGSPHFAPTDEQLPAKELAVDITANIRTRATIKTRRKAGRSLILAAILSSPLKYTTEMTTP
jgi:hypothetical protein